MVNEKTGIRCETKYPFSFAYSILGCISKDVVVQSDGRDDNSGVGNGIPKIAAIVVYCRRSIHSTKMEKEILNP